MPVFLAVSGRRGGDCDGGSKGWMEKRRRAAVRSAWLSFPCLDSRGREEDEGDREGGERGVGR